MAIRNNKLGGSDFVNGEVLYDYDLDDTNNEIINLAAKGVAQNAYQTLKHVGTFDNEDSLGADRFTDEDGVKNTVNTGSSTAVYNTTSDYYELGITDEAPSDTTHDPDSFTDPENAFDGDNSTFASKSSSGALNESLGKTFATATYQKAFIKCFAETSAAGSGSSKSVSAILESFDGSTWNSVQTLFNTSGFDSTINDSFEDSVDISSQTNIQGLRVRLTASDELSQVVRLHTLEYGNRGDSTLLCDSNIKTLTGNEKSICVYGKKTKNIFTGAGDGTDDIDSHGLSLSTSNSTTSKTGIKIKPMNNRILSSINKVSGTDATHAYLYEENETLVEKVAFSGDVATFTTNRVLSVGKKYYILIDKEGSSYTTLYNTAPSYPINLQNVIITKGVSASTSPFTEQTNIFYNIESITTQDVTGSLTQITNITYDVSDGTTTISDLELNTVNGIDSLGAGQLEITFNLSTTDSNETPELYGYSYYIN